MTSSELTQALNEAIKSNNLPLVQVLVEQQQADIEQFDKGGSTALHEASRRGHLTIVQYLVQSRRANVETTNSYGWTALHWACCYGRLAVVKYLIEDCGANEHHCSDNGWTLVHRGSFKGQLAVVQYLVETCRVDMDAVGNENETALDLAQETERDDVIEYLQARRRLLESSVVVTANVATPEETIASDSSWLVDTTVAVAVAIAPTLEAVTASSTALTSRNDADANAKVIAVHEFLDEPSKTGEEFGSTKGRAAAGMDSSVLLKDQANMRSVVDGSVGATIVSERYIQSILTDTILGQGFFGTAYLGVDTSLSRSFAVKVVNTELFTGTNRAALQAAKNTFESEQQALSRFRHPNVAHVLAYSFPNDIPGNYYLVYDMADKGSLDSYLHDDDKRLSLSFARRLQIAIDIMTALQFLHTGDVDKNITPNFHRDVKSAKIVLQRDWTAQLLDCGLGRFVVDQNDGSMSRPSGTPGYICPEYWNGELKGFDCACDVYAFGVVLVELWTGKLQNHTDDNGDVFNFSSQYIKMKKGKTKRDMVEDVDFTFGFSQSGTLPNYAIQFAELARSCMGDHEDIPVGANVLNELEAIHQACLAGDEGNATAVGSVPLAFSEEDVLRESSDFDPDIGRFDTMSSVFLDYPSLSATNQPSTVPTLILGADQRDMQKGLEEGQPAMAVSNDYIQSIKTNVELGRGFFGVTFRGIDRSIGTEFEVKVLNTDVFSLGSIDDIHRAKQAIEKEQQALNRYNHPNIAHLLAYSFPDDLHAEYCLVYEVVGHGHLDTFWKDNARSAELCFCRRVQIALDVITALQFLHVGMEEKRITRCYHRDVKSGTIVLKRDWTAQLIDCGLSTLVSETDNIKSQSLSTSQGSRGYVCPEYTLGGISFDCACDIYSLGVVLVELWTGKLQNHKGEDGRSFNFAQQYTKGRKGARRDIMLDADPLFRSVLSDTHAADTILPSLMTRFVDLALQCIDFHNKIPTGAAVMIELGSICRSCVAHKDIVALDSPQVVDILGEALCGQCRTFLVVLDESLCRICFDSTERRKMLTS